MYILLGIIAAVYAFFTGIGLVHKAVEGFFPRTFFFIFYSWCWPFRKDDAGTLVAMAIRAKPEDFRLNSWNNTINGTINGSVIQVETAKWDGYCELRIDKEYIPVSTWGAHKLWSTYHILNHQASRKSSRKRNTENKQRAINGTRKVAQLLLKGDQNVIN